MSLKTWRRSSTGWAARFVAGLFLVHALLLGFSLGVHAQPVPLDQFGNVLCVTGEGESGHDGSGHGKAPGTLDCCALGCSQSGSSLVPPPLEASMPARRPVAAKVPFLVYEDVGSRLVETPRKTRAPPLSA